MHLNTIVIALLATGFSTGALADNSIAGMQQCKANPPAPVAIGDRPNHALATFTAECTWVKPMEMGGLKTKDGVDTISTEIDGNKAADHGYYLGTMTNGDKYTIKFSGSTHTKDGKPVAAEGTWSFTEGQGKLHGLKGGGTYKGAPNPDGTMSYQVEGKYTLP